MKASGSKLQKGVLISGIVYSVFFVFSIVFLPSFNPAYNTAITTIQTAFRIALCVLSYYCASSIGRSPFLWALGAFVFPFIIPLVLGFMPKADPPPVLSDPSFADGTLSFSTGEFNYPDRGGVEKTSGRASFTKTAENSPQTLYWAYLHKYGSIQVKEWYPNNTYLQEARTSPNIKTYLEHPFEAASLEEAQKKAGLLLGA